MISSSLCILLDGIIDLGKRGNMKLHSVVDIITNSSAEIYVIPTDKTKEEAIRILQELWSQISDNPWPFTEGCEKALVGYRSSFKYDDEIEKILYPDEIDREKWHTSLEYNIGDILLSAGYYWGFGKSIFEGEDYLAEEKEQEDWENILKKNFPEAKSYQTG